MKTTCPCTGIRRVLGLPQAGWALGTTDMRPLEHWQPAGRRVRAWVPTMIARMPDGTIEPMRWGTVLLRRECLARLEAEAPQWVRRTDPR